MTFIDLLLAHSEVRGASSLHQAGWVRSDDATLGHISAAQCLWLAEGGEIVSFGRSFLQSTQERDFQVESVEPRIQSRVTIHAPLNVGETRRSKGLQYVRKAAT